MMEQFDNTQSRFQARRFRPGRYPHLHHMDYVGGGILSTLAVIPWPVGASGVVPR